MDRILVIDDDRAVTDALQRGLGLEGFTVDAANSVKKVSRSIAIEIPS
ncbi:MAG: hypothetical protein R2849_05600 [Thermomicrobiales bacterium]